MLEKQHLDQMRHAVGYYSGSPGYRNHFASESDDSVWCLLVDHGLAEGMEGMGFYNFRVTESGKALIGLEEQKRFKEEIDRCHEKNIDSFCEYHGIDK